MKTPIKDFIDEYVSKNTVRMHMPAHKGKSPSTARDITEIEGADSLYEASGVIAESEKNASELFGCETYYSAEGSSLAIRAMLYLAILNSGKTPDSFKVLAGRNAHKVFVNTAALLGFSVEWLFSPADGYLSCLVDADMLDARICEMDDKPDALYITTPDYLGNMADVLALSKVCRKHGVMLLVDNAHGAYLKFLPASLHPSDLGADMVCDSAHKTLPVLTGGAYLHISKNVNKEIRSRAKEALVTFGSTSPSYLILESLDKANKTIKEEIIPNMQTMICKIHELKEKITKVGYEPVGDEKMKITIKTKSYGYLGTEISRLLEECGIYPEFADPDYLVLMPSWANEAEFERVLDALLSIPKREAVLLSPPEMTPPEKVFSVREALFLPSEEISVEESLGRILSSANIACPPAVPIVVSGERIDSCAIEAFKYYGIERIRVVK